MVNRPISNIEEKYKRHLSFLNRSAEAYDHGHVDEDIRLAQSIRVLFHQTKTSHSIVSQLGMDPRLIDSSCQLTPGNTLGQMPLVQTGYGDAQGNKFFAPLSKSDRKNSIPFENWWNQLVFTKEGDLTFSRKRLILQMANKEGGSHVDPKLTPDFVAIQKYSLGFNFFNEDNSANGNDVTSVTIRQITHEVLASLVDGYEKTPDKSNFDFITTHLSSVVGNEISKISRNNPCPCQSGLKYKKCHGFV